MLSQLTPHSVTKAKFTAKKTKIIFFYFNAYIFLFNAFDVNNARLETNLKSCYNGFMAIITNKLIKKIHICQYFQENKAALFLEGVRKKHNKKISERKSGQKQSSRYVTQTYS